MGLEELKSVSKRDTFRGYNFFTRSLFACPNNEPGVVSMHNLSLLKYSLEDIIHVLCVVGHGKQAVHIPCGNILSY